MRERAAESNQESVPGRGAEQSVPRPTPLTLVSGAIAGDELATVMDTVADVLGRTVAIAIPELGAPLISPRGALDDEHLTAIQAHGVAVVRGIGAPPAKVIAESVPVQIGAQVVGVIVATDLPSPSAGREFLPAGERRAWLEAGAAAASVAALIRDARDAASVSTGVELVRQLAAGPPEDPAALLLRARRAGIELSAGATALAARPPIAEAGRAVLPVETGKGVLVAFGPGGRLLALLSAQAGQTAAELAIGFRQRGLIVATSSARGDPAGLHEALREAELLVELAVTPEANLEGQEETYRLLIGVLLRDPEELQRLRAGTISPLADYDARHDTDLLVTLRAFLAHDGSTTETAEVMRLHRHTVGYRLSRVHEVSGLSPYASEGRERLSLGLKADQILLAAARLDEGPGRG